MSNSTTKQEKTKAIVLYDTKTLMNKFINFSRIGAEVFKNFGSGA